MKRRVREKVKELGVQYSLLLFGIGAVLAYAGLIINQQFPVTLSLASMLSPTGARFAVGGFRIKHWLVGALLGFVAVGLYASDSKNLLLKQVGLVVAGIGVLLILDEYEAVWRFLTTGAYP